MKTATSMCVAFTVMLGYSLGVPASHASINYSVAGVGPTSFPAPTTPPANAPWGPNGYPGDTVEIAAYSSTLDLTPGTVVQKINTLLWTIDYTYGGTATDPNAWSDLQFAIDAVRDMTLDGTTKSLTQQGSLEATWENDYLGLAEGATTTFLVGGFQIDVTPLGLAEVGGSNFDGGNPWTQPTRDVMARFVITEIAVPEASTIAVWSVLSLIGAGVAYRQRAQQA